MSLREQLALKLEEAKAAYTKGDIITGDTLKAEAEALQNAIKALGSLEEIQIPEEKPNKVATAAAILPTTPAKGALPVEEEPQEDTTVKAAYVSHFGTTEKAVDTILRDLHGNDYQQVYWDQRKAFNYFLRSDPQSQLPQWVTKGLSEIVLTPNAIKAALNEGLGSVEALKATMVEGSLTLGGAIVPVDFQARVIERLQGLTVMRGRAFGTLEAAHGDAVLGQTFV